VAERCGHCGREGTLEHVESVVLNSVEVEVAPGPGPDDVLMCADQDVLQIRRCTVCHEPTIHRYWWLDSPWSEPDDARDYRRIHPLPRDNTQLPPRVAARYAEMLQVANLPDAFAVRAGKVLEAVCAAEGLPVTPPALDLSARLDQLASRNHSKIPPALRDQAQLVRRYRNVGGHDNDFDVEEDDVPLLRDFVEAILDYLYRGPAKLEAGREKLAERQR
jgi:hypothetical protein